MICDTTLPFDGGYLKILQLGDVHEGYVDGLNDNEVNHYLDNVKHSVQTKDGIKAFIQHNIDSKDSMFFGIWQHGAEMHCGTVRLYGVENFHHTAHIGICIFDKATWGRGLGSKAVGAVSSWALTRFKLRWIEAGAFEDNIASQKVFLSAGYEWVYDIPNKYLIDGQPSTVKVYALHNSTNIDNNNSV